MARNTKKEELFTVKEVVLLLILTCVANTMIFFLINNNGEEKNFVNTTDDALDEIIESYYYIKDNYYGEINEKDLINGAIKGMTEALGDDYSTFIEESDSDTYDILLKGEYIGVGIQISQLINSNEIIVTTVFENSPAGRAGLMLGDVVKSINGIKADTMTTTTMGDYIKNGNITTFEIVVDRNGEEKKFKVSRGNIVLDSVVSQMIDNAGKKVGYINMNVFALNTDEQFKEHLKKLEKEGMDSLIIDVRANTGGHLSTVTNIISEFLDSSKVIYQTSGKTTKVVNSKGRETKKYKIVILADNGSASASEVLLAALKESYGATFVGQTTFGKGTVQEMQTISSTGENYKITTKKWLTPQGNWINKVGIKPDYEVILNNEYYENPTMENDNQLQEALKLLK